MKFASTLLLVGCLCALTAGTAVAQDNEGAAMAPEAKAQPATPVIVSAPYVVYYTSTYGYYHGGYYGRSSHFWEGTHPYHSYYRSYSYHHSYHHHHHHGGGDWLYFSLF